ncbi:MAG: hypothetical protein J6K88_05365 [Oscillospiraceae bacterium]|nr:hypothetical protein [Oscillospiraceae bacterium]
MKNIFTNPEIEVIKFANEDIVTTSPTSGGGGVQMPDDDFSLLLDLDA